MILSPKAVYTYLFLLALGCSKEENSTPPPKGTEAVVVAESCSPEQLMEICPINTSPILDTVAAVECEDDESVISNSRLCRSEGSCSISCQVDMACEGTFIVREDAVVCNEAVENESCIDQLELLSEACPPNTTPNIDSVGESSCSTEGADVICISQGGCNISCEPQCDFGVAEITEQSVICNPEPACGNEVCEGGENEVSCPQDCDQRECAAGESRCVGVDISTCDASGRWTDAVPCTEN
jgi:hypothetical protein